MITSVHTIQTSIKNAPDNVIGMVKGISDNIITNTVDTFNKINPVGSSATASSTIPNSQSTSSGFSTMSLTSSNNFSSSTIPSPNAVQPSINLTNNLKQSSSSIINNKSKLNQNELNLIDRTILNDEIV